MKMLVFAATAALLGLAMPANAKTPDDRFCGFTITDDEGVPQTVLFKHKKNENIEAFKAEILNSGGTFACGAEMRAAYKAFRAEESRDLLRRTRPFPARLPFRRFN